MSKQNDTTTSPARANNRYASVDFTGGCPECGGTDGYFNVGRGHWFVCHHHKVKWFGGSNLFSSWQSETEDKQRSAWQSVCDYEDVEPVFPA